MRRTRSEGGEVFDGWCGIKAEGGKEGDGVQFSTEQMNLKR